MRKPTAGIVIVLVALGAVAGFHFLTGGRSAAVQFPTEHTAPPAASALPSSGPLTPEASQALVELEQLHVAAPNQVPYNRKAFGQAWADTNRNGCDTRNDVLRRDLVDVTTKPGTHDCVVLSGILHDPYTGSDITFTRGQGTSEAVQIDHMVPLAWAYKNGAADWTPQRREQFANDFLNLTAVDGPANQAKSDSGPALWMPPNGAYRCTYAARFVHVLSTYALSVPADDAGALRGTLTTCSGSTR